MDEYAALGTELIAPLLILSPFAVKWCRILAVLIFWSFHLGIMVTLHVGIFSLAGIAAWTAFIPAEVLVYLSKMERGPFSWPIKAFQVIIEKISSFTSRQGKSTAPDPGRRRFFQALSLLLLTVSMATLMVDTIANIPQQTSVTKPELLTPLRKSLRLDQRWNMFARPFYHDGGF